MEDDLLPLDSELSDELRAELLEDMPHLEGKIELRTTFPAFFNPPPAYDAERIRTLRINLGFSQPYFSRWLNVSLKTVQSWEQGARMPSQASARLLQLIENPHLLDGFRWQPSQSL